jgi:hypothetical protein
VHAVHLQRVWLTGRSAVADSRWGACLGCHTLLQQRLPSSLCTRSDTNLEGCLALALVVGAPCWAPALLLLARLLLALLVFCILVACGDACRAAWAGWCVRVWAATATACTACMLLPPALCGADAGTHASSTAHTHSRCTHTQPTERDRQRPAARFACVTGARSRCVCACCLFSTCFWHLRHLHLLPLIIKLHITVHG